MNLTRRRLITNLGMTGGALLGSRFLPAGFGGILDAALGGATTRPAASQPSETRWEISARRKSAIAKNIVWLSWEPIEFLFRRGDHFDDEPEHYQRMLSPDNLKRMADAGVLCGRLFFYKGFGLEYERHNMELVHQAADTMHQLGMKVSLYFAGTMFTETLYREIPEAQGWEQRDQNNHWIPYGMQTYRHYACPNEPKYRDYLKRILKVGIHEIKADEIAFDNIMLQPEPQSCRCWRCLKAFQEFLREHYPDGEAVQRRFGLPDVESIHVNEWTPSQDPTTLTTLDDPVLQEWTGFRCRTLANYANALYDMVKRMNPDVAVHFNIKGVFSYNRYWTNAVYQPFYAGKIDTLAFDTSGYSARIDPNTGALVSQIRSFKMARRIKSNCEENHKEELAAAVHMAFGYQKPLPSLVPAPFATGAHQTFNPLMEFFRHYNDRYFTRTELVADVAVLHNWPSMAYSINANYIPATLMEQVLIQYKIPFDLLFDEQLENLDRYGAVILAGQESVSESQAQMLLQYARDGGTLVIAGNTGNFNDWREKRHINAFLDITPDPNAVPDYDNDGWKPDHLTRNLPPERTEGKGRVIFIANIIPGVEPGSPMSPDQWVLPRNHKEIYQRIVNGLPNDLSITTEAPLTTVAELLTRPSTRETIAHFINFDRDKKLPAFAVSIRKQFSGPVKSVASFSPATDDPVAVDFQDSGDKVSFSVPGMGIYSMVVVAQQAVALIRNQFSHRWGPMHTDKAIA